MIDVIVDEGVDMHRMPDVAQVTNAAQAACTLARVSGAQPELCIRFAGDEAVRQLNREWRDRDEVTDVLSFPMQDGDIDAAAYLGDIALAVPYVEREATRLALPAADHALHLIVHGVLHLLGHDHEKDDDAVRMQSLERRVLAALGLHDPYPEAREERGHAG